MKYILLASTIVALCTTSLSKDKTQQETCADGLREYSQVLDTYFSHARGYSPSAIVLRMYGGLLAEDEIVLNPEVSNHSIFVYTAGRSIWGNVYSLSRPHRTIDEYGKDAIAIPFSKREVELKEAQFLDLFARANRIDTPICEDLSRGRHPVIAHDAFEFEIIKNTGNARSRVMDTRGSKRLSQNPALLRWALDVQEASGMR